MQELSIGILVVIILATVGPTSPLINEGRIMQAVSSVIGKDTLEGCTRIIYSDAPNVLASEVHLPTILFYFPVSRSYANLSVAQFSWFPLRYGAACSFNHWFEPAVLPNTFWTQWDAEYLERIPGGIFQSYHLIHTLISGTRYFRGNVPRIVTQMHHCLLINEHSSSDFDLFTPGVWYNESFQVSSTSNSQSEEVATQGFFYSKWKDYGRYGPIVLATTPDNDPSDVTTYLKTKKVTNYVITNAVLFAEYLNTTPAVLPIRNGVYGTKDKKTGKWVGMVGALVAGRAHLTSVIGLDLERSEVVRYTLTVGFDRVNFITPFPKEKRLSGSVTFLVFPFTGFVWGATFASLLSLWFTICLEYYVKVKIQSLDKDMSILNVTLYYINVLLRPIFDQPSIVPTKPLKRIIKAGVWTRFLFLIWLLVLIVLTSTYKSRMISTLLKPNEIHPPKTFEELAHSKFSIGSILFNETVVGDGFRKMNSLMSKEILRRVKGYGYLQPGCFIPIKTLDHACLGLATFLRNNAMLFLTDKNGQQMYKTSKESIMHVAASSVVLRRFPHLLGPLDVIIGRLYSTGVIEYNLRTHGDFTSLRGRHLSKLGKFSTSTVGEKPKRRSGARHLIIILIIGNGTALGLFLFEIAIYFRACRANGKMDS